jgi:hypothetical protein
MQLARALRIACWLAVLPTAAFAQRGIGGLGSSIGRRRPGTLEREPALVVPKQVNVVNLLVEHRQDLALSDSQFRRVIAIKRSLDSANAPYVRRIDSLQRTFKGGPIFSEPTPQRRDSLLAARSIVLELQADIRDNIVPAREQAFALLSSTQLTKAQEIEAQAEKALAEENKKSAERSRGGGGLGRPPR